MRIRDWDQNLKVRLSGEALMNISYWMFFPFLTIYFTDEFGKNRAGLLLIFSQFFAVLANLLGGYSADRFGRKRMMVFSSVGQGLSFVTFAFASSPWLQSPRLGFAAYTFAGVFGSLYWPASQAMVADVVDEKNRSEVFAIFYTSLNIAVVVGPLLGAIFYVYYRFELLLISGIICLLLGFMLSKWTRETALLQAGKTSTLQEGKWSTFLQNQLSNYKIIAQDKIFLMYIFAGILAGLASVQIDLLLPVYIKDVLKSQTVFASFIVNGEQTFGIVLAENGLLVALLTVLVTKWMANYYERNVFILSSFIWAISIILFSQTHSFWGFILSMAVYTFGELSTSGIQQGFVAKIAPERMRGQYFAVSSLRYTFSRMIAPIFIPMTVWIGYTWTFFVLAILSLLSAGLYWLMFHRLEQGKAQTN